MNECAGGCAWVAGLQIFFWYGVYGWTIFGLPPRVLGPHDSDKGPWAGPWVQRAHAVLSWVTICGALVGGYAAGDMLVEAPLSLGLGTLLTVGMCNTVNGLFELVTGVSPTYGVIHQRRRPSHYLRHPRARRLGLARLLVSLVLAGVAAAIVALP
jgi:hypothetical protein